MTLWPELLAAELDKHAPKAPSFVRGHHVIGHGFHVFPHICPGVGCAVNAWIQAHAKTDPTTPSPSSSSQTAD